MPLTSWTLSLAAAIYIALGTAAVYAAVLIGLRVSGKREIGQMTIFDLVVLLLISNGVQNAMVGSDTTVPGGLIAALVLLVLNVGVAQVTLRVPRLRRLVEGTPTVLVTNGVAVQENLRREGIDEQLLEAAIREHGVSKITDTELVVLEVDGSISVVPVGQTVKRTRKPMKYLRRG
jgi:uncharacterized membrane protein YcaP (DUF421 family)